MADEAFVDLLAALEWGATLDLTPDQREQLGALCCKIGGCVPRALLIAERKKRQTRVEEMETALRSKRDEWVFRRKKSDSRSVTGT